MNSVSFHSEQTDLSLANESLLAEWLVHVCKRERKNLTAVSIIFCSDDHLLEMNRKHLDHDYYTDVITFDYSEDDHISGDVFISVDRVRENAAIFNVPFLDELHRVMVHGVLHLLGYTDSGESAKEEMTAKEDFYLSLRPF